MKQFDPHLVTITQEEYLQLKVCEAIADELWMIYGPYDFPKELREPNNYTQISERGYKVSIRQRLEKLMDFDDSE